MGRSAQVAAACETYPVRAGSVKELLEALEADVADGSDSERSAWGHLQRARREFRGEHQLAEYVARLTPAELAEILASTPHRLPHLAANHAECRVEATEERGFVEVMRAWALYTLSGLE